MLFAGLWVTLVYFPVAHWVFAFDSDDGSVVGGWIANKLGAIALRGRHRRPPSTPVSPRWRWSWCSASGTRSRTCLGRTTFL